MLRALCLCFLAALAAAPAAWLAEPPAARAAAAPPLASAAFYTRCAGVVLPGGSPNDRTSTVGAVWALHVGCRTARRVAHIYMSVHERQGRSVHPLGFRCSGGADGVACRQGRRRVTWGYYWD